MSHKEPYVVTDLTTHEARGLEAERRVTPELTLDLAARHVDDHAVPDALRAHGIPPAAQAWFDGQRVEDELQHTGTICACATIRISSKPHRLRRPPARGSRRSV
jgi:hypothetical protein